LAIGYYFYTIFQDIKTTMSKENEAFKNIIQNMIDFNKAYECSFKELLKNQKEELDKTILSLASSRCTNKSIAKKIPHEKCDKN
jgi:hypothetical protein